MIAWGSNLRADLCRERGAPETCWLAVLGLEDCGGEFLEDLGVLGGDLELPADVLLPGVGGALRLDGGVFGVREVPSIECSLSSTPIAVGAFAASRDVFDVSPGGSMPWVLSPARLSGTCLGSVTAFLNIRFAFITLSMPPALKTDWARLLTRVSRASLFWIWSNTAS